MQYCYNAILQPKTIFYSVWLTSLWFTSLTLFTHPHFSLFSLHLLLLCLLAWWLYYHGWWISRSTIARLVVVFLWVFLGGCWPVLWWVCLVMAGFFWCCDWVFLIGADGFGSVIGLINVVVVDGLMGLGSVMGWWLFMLVVVVVAGDDLGFCFYLDFRIYYFIM